MDSKEILSFGKVLYATPVGNHFYRISIQYRKENEGIVVTMLCGKCNKLWEENFKEGDTVSSIIKCPHCKYEEVT